MGCGCGLSWSRRGACPATTIGTWCDPLMEEASACPVTNGTSSASLPQNGRSIGRGEVARTELRPLTPEGSYCGLQVRLALEHRRAANANGQLLAHSELVERAPDHSTTPMDNLGTNESGIDPLPDPICPSFRISGHCMSNGCGEQDASIFLHLQGPSRAQWVRGPLSGQSKGGRRHRNS